MVVHPGVVVTATVVVTVVVSAVVVDSVVVVGSHIVPETIKLILNMVMFQKFQWVPYLMHLFGDFFKKQTILPLTF